MSLYPVLRTNAVSMVSSTMDPRNRMEDPLQDPLADPLTGSLKDPLMGRGGSGHVSNGGDASAQGEIVGGVGAGVDSGSTGVFQGDSEMDGGLDGGLGSHGSIDGDSSRVGSDDNQGSVAAGPAGEAASGSAGHIGYADSRQENTSFEAGNTDRHLSSDHIGSSTGSMEDVEGGVGGDQVGGGVSADSLDYKRVDTGSTQADLSSGGVSGRTEDTSVAMYEGTGVKADANVPGLSGEGSADKVSGMGAGASSTSGEVSQSGAHFSQEDRTSHGFEGENVALGGERHGVGADGSAEKVTVNGSNVGEQSASLDEHGASVGTKDGENNALDVEGGAVGVGKGDAKVEAGGSVKAGSSSKETKGTMGKDGASLGGEDVAQGGGMEGASLGAGGQSVDVPDASAQVQGDGDVQVDPLNASAGADVGLGGTGVGIGPYEPALPDEVSVGGDLNLDEGSMELRVGGQDVGVDAGGGAQVAKDAVGSAAGDALEGASLGGVSDQLAGPAASALAPVMDGLGRGAAVGGAALGQAAGIAKLGGSLAGSTTAMAQELAMTLPGLAAGSAGRLAAIGDAGYSAGKDLSRGDLSGLGDLAVVAGEQLLGQGKAVVGAAADTGAAIAGRASEAGQQIVGQASESAQVLKEQLSEGLTAGAAAATAAGQKVNKAAEKYVGEAGGYANEAGGIAVGAAGEAGGSMIKGAKKAGKSLKKKLKKIGDLFKSKKSKRKKRRKARKNRRKDFRKLVARKVIFHRSGLIRADKKMQRLAKFEVTMRADVQALAAVEGKTVTAHYDRLSATLKGTSKKQRAALEDAAMQHKGSLEQSIGGLEAQAAEGRASLESGAAAQGATLRDFVIDAHGRAASRASASSEGLDQATQGEAAGLVSAMKDGPAETLKDAQARARALQTGTLTHSRAISLQAVAAGGGLAAEAEVKVEAIERQGASAQAILGEQVQATGGIVRRAVASSSRGALRTHGAASDSTEGAKAAGTSKASTTVAGASIAGQQAVSKGIEALPARVAGAKEQSNVILSTKKGKAEADAKKRLG